MNEDDKIILLCRGGIAIFDLVGITPSTAAIQGMLLIVIREFSGFYSNFTALID